MKRTGKKSKIGRPYKCKWADGCEWLLKYDRKYVARHHSEVRHLPFSRTSCGFWSYLHFRREVRRHIERFLLKHVGMDADIVFHKFCRLGWANTYDMYEMWSCLVNPWNYLQKGMYYISEEGTLEANE